MSDKVYSEEILNAYKKYLEENIPTGIPKNIREALVEDTLKNKKGIEQFVRKTEINPDFAKHYLHK
jgi:hypothetical protein